MMYVLDTNVVSELRKIRSGKADANVMAWADSVGATNSAGARHGSGTPQRSGL